MQGKTVIITGASSGIGLATAKALGEKGAELVLVARSSEKLLAVEATIKDATGNQNISSHTCDLSVQAEVRALAAAIAAQHPKIHVLINNAGNMFTKRTLSADGIEMAWALNHLGYFLLTNLLLENIKAAGKARIVNVSSMAHARGVIDFDDLMMERKYTWMSSYSRSKLANVLFTFDLARRLKGSGVTVNCLHPGVVGTNFGNGNGLLYRTGFAIARPFILSPEQGALTSIYLASAADAESVTGGYFVKCRQAPPAAQAHNEALQNQLWDVSAEMVGGL